MSSKSGSDQALIKEQLKGNGGDSTSAISWRFLGGGFRNGQAVGTVTITPGQLVFAMGVRARLHDLSKLGVVIRRSKPVCKIPGTTGDGYWLSAASGGASSSSGVAGRYAASRPRVAAPVNVDPDDHLGDDFVTQPFTGVPAVSAPTSQPVRVVSGEAIASRIDDLDGWLK